jgi:type IV secretory pathway VirB2 component (pilin)
MSTSVSPGRRRAVAFAFVLLAIVASPVLAHAQAVGGAGGTFLNGLLTWVQSNVLTTIGTLAIICAGIVMLSMRISVVAIIAVCAGIWVIFNASTIISFLQS